MTNTTIKTTEANIRKIVREELQGSPFSQIGGIGVPGSPAANDAFDDFTADYYHDPAPTDPLETPMSHEEAEQIARDLCLSDTECNGLSVVSDSLEMETDDMDGAQAPVHTWNVELADQDGVIAAEMSFPDHYPDGFSIDWGGTVSGGMFEAASVLE